MRLFLSGRIKILITARFIGSINGTGTLAKRKLDFLWRDRSFRLAGKTGGGQVSLRNDCYGLCGNVGRLTWGDWCRQRIRAGGRQPGLRWRDALTMAELWVAEATGMRVRDVLSVL
jgi:hypothetical protein